MSKKHFIALANMVREANEAHCKRTYSVHKPFGETAINRLADFCQEQNSRFNRARWIAYINGECGPNGGARKDSEAPHTSHV